jgi:SAM-dependent methyltransferase
MLPNDTDSAWEYFGNTDPYFSVLTWDEYKKEKISADSRKRFFESGDAYIKFVLQIVHDYLDPAFQPGKATVLDFGCGVGRLVIPLAKECKSVTGVDISDAMLSEAIKNCQEYGVSNVDFIKGDDKVTGFYDFIHSFIVLQHIPPWRGEMILKRLIALLRNDGIGAIHFTYYRKESFAGRLRYFIYRTIPFSLGFRNLLKGRPFGEPIMQMNEYNLNNIIRILQESDCHHSVMRFTRHTDTYGVILFFQKKRLPLL